MLAVLGAAVAAVAGGFSSRHSAGSAASSGSASSGSRGSSGSQASGNGSSSSTQVDPLKTTAAKRLVANRDGRISAAVENLKTGKVWLLDRGDRDQTASIVKADILETLLYQHEHTAGGIASVENDVAEGMIEASDNDDATQLWDEDGGSSGIAAYNRLAGLTETTPNTDGFWGETITSAKDQLALLRQLALPSKLLTKAAQRYQLYLMRHIDPGENWGVTGGVPAGVSVALKNGWVPLTSYSDWEINSIGWVKGDGRDYLIAVLTAHDPSEQYGIDTIDSLSADVYRSLKP